MQLLTSLSTRGKITLAACALGFLIAALFIVKTASAPSYTEVMAGIDPAQTGKISAALDAKGIKYELRSNGTAVAVEKSQLAQANITLAEGGLNTGATQPGFELLDKQKLGTSNFQQQVNYQRALEGQIANNVGQIQGVQGARVSLTLPKDELFADEKQPATASVLLGGGESTLEAASVRGIANLVASSVEGLKTANVTITDGSGVMLWPSGDGAGGGLVSKQSAQARYNAQVQSSLNALLTQTLGAGKAQVAVNSDLNVDKASQEELIYGKKATPLQNQTSKEKLTSKGGATGGTSGTATNIPAYAQANTGGAGASSNYDKTDTNQTLGVDKKVVRTQIAPGAVNRQSVAVMVDKTIWDGLGKTGQKSMTDSLSAAAGLVAGRDTIAMTPVVFPKVVEAPVKAGPIPAGMLGYAKTAGLGLAALLFLFFVSRFLKKRESGAFAEEPSWLRALEAPAGGGALGAGAAGDAATTEQAAAMPDNANLLFRTDPQAMALENLVEREPEKVAMQLRSWITEDGR